METQMSRELQGDRYLNLSFILFGVTVEPETVVTVLEAVDGFDDVRAGQLEEITHVDLRFDRGGRGTGPATAIASDELAKLFECEVLAGGVGKLGRIRAEEWVGARAVDGPGGDFR